MQLTKLSLKNFRNHSAKELSFNKGITLIVGSNAIGKTNILESIYLLATGKSFRADVESEMILRGQEIARVKGEIKIYENIEKLEIMLTTGQVMGIRSVKKRYLVNGVARRMVDFVGKLLVVYFSPEDLEIIIDGPVIRRNYLDLVLEQVDRDYRRVNLSYRKGLRQRNKLLEQIRDEGKPRNVLFFWDKLLIENGNLLTQKRQEYIDYINDGDWGFGKLFIEYDKSIISPQRLEQYVRQEVASATTLVGPHRDDFRVTLAETAKEDGQIKRDLHVYGSRGEQRTAIFGLKLAQLAFIKEKTQQSPVLLLDDIFSELDHNRRKKLLEIIPHQQTIITTSDIHLVEPEFRDKIEIVNFN